MSTSLLLALGVVSSGADKANWKAYDFGCKGLRIELPVPLKKVVKTVKTPKGATVTTTNYQASFGEVGINVFVMPKPSEAALAKIPDAIHYNEQLAMRMAGITRPKFERFHENRNGFDAFLTVVHPLVKSKELPVAESFLGKRQDLIVMIALAAKTMATPNMEILFRVENSVSFKKTPSK